MKWRAENIKDLEHTDWMNSFVAGLALGIAGYLLVKEVRRQRQVKF